MVDVDLKTALIGIPLAIFLFFAVGLKVSSARNEAAAPLVSQCPGVLWKFTTGTFGVPEIVPYTECIVGALILVVIPRAFGIAMLGLRGR
jgi:uncharacterized membrane protein YkgB